MNILLAVSDRDLLRSYTRLLEADGYSVRTAFDGPQTMKRMDAEQTDLLIAEEALPGCTADQLIRKAEERNIHSILLTEIYPGSARLLQLPLPSAFLTFPFEPDELRRVIRSIAEKVKASEPSKGSRIGVKPAGFCLANSGIRLTAAEMDLLSAAEQAESFRGTEARTLIVALNEKLKASGSRQRIAYEMRKGYKLVEDNE